MAAIFEGSGVALITPFLNGEVDTQAIRRLVEMQIQAGTAAIVACGTTGEPATMTADECELVVRTCCEAAGGRIAIIAGTGSNDTRHVIETAKRYEGLGCAAQLVVTPYYNKANKEGLYRHYMTIAERTELPIFIYNVPSRTGIDMQPDMLRKLSQCERFVGVKESSYDYPTVMEKFMAVQGTQVYMYSGNDDMNYALLSLGGKGTVSVAANFIPGKLSEMVNNYLHGNKEAALLQQMALMPINRALFNEVNPIPCKAAMEILGLCGGELRLPLYEISSENRVKLIDALKGLGLVQGMERMNIIISGALGRMGKELTQAAKASGIEIVCGVDAAVQVQTEGFPLVRGYHQISEHADVLIDFSTTDTLDALLEYGLKSATPLVLCVTGYSQEQLAQIKKASKQIPILQSANMSFGVHVMAQLAAMAARVLGSDFDIEIVEKHHSRKVDSPSGTALMLFETIQKEREWLSPVYGRHGKTGERHTNEIGLHAIRGGTISGEHEVGFYGNAEEIILTHRAENRALFARGALRGAAFLVTQPPGLYSLKDAVAESMRK